MLSLILAIILNEIPISGTWPEKHFGTIELQNVWVQFDQTNGESWHGSFAASNYKFGLTDLVYDEKTNMAFISAGGTGYYVNTETRELIFETEDFQPMHSVIRTENPNYLVYSNQEDVYFLSGNQVEKTVNLGFVDGVYITAFEEGNLIGDLWEINSDHYNIRFYINISTFEYRTDNKTLIDRKSYTEFKPAEPPKGFLETLFGRKR